ncbi:hypothetical protein [Pseudomonas sp. QD4]|uniref:hypothetical protein n=1 Tax=Pseudomonas sp. QD4 TaxID=3368618 RepID=UPI003BA3CE37
MSDGLRLPAPLRYLSLLLVLGASGNCLAMSLDQQFAGLASCSVEQVFLDPSNQQLSGQYFVERQLQPCDLDEGARFCVKDQFHGLAVHAIGIPYRGPFSVHALYLDADVQTARQQLGQGFDGDGVQAPLLIADPKNPGGSVLYCDPDSQ